MGKKVMLTGKTTRQRRKEISMYKEEEKSSKMKKILLKYMEEFIQDYQERNNLSTRWKQPLLGFVNSNKKYIHSLKTIVSPTHYMPEEFLPYCKSILSYFLPFDDKIGKDNENGTEPSTMWITAYNETNRLFVDLNQFLSQIFEKFGYQVATPHQVGMIDKTHIYSNWSQRHIAYAAGLGTFGINNMLITKEGTCGRFYSLITNFPVEKVSPISQEYCLYKKDGSCGLCVKRCPIHALSLNREFDRIACEEHLAEIETRLGADACGKCVTGLPCTYRIPNVDKNV